VSVTAAKGFVAAGVACGIKKDDDLDLAIVATDDHRPVTAVAVFTANKATAAPVQVTRAHLAATGNRAVGVVLNSGNANAATGERGRADAERMCALAAEGLGCQPEEVLVCSTGLIGFELPMGPIERGIPAAVNQLATAGGHEAALAILTTDTHDKQVSVVESGMVVGGMAKGAAMLAPNMATMLAVLTTSAEADVATLQTALQRAVDESFNALSVDGCTSTNDTVILLANGRSGPVPAAVLTDALTRVCCDLAAEMAGDAEGATKVVRVEVSGARSDEEGRRGARAIAESQLVKCSWYGEDPYWGRVVSELGSADIEFDPDRVSVAYNGVMVCEGGVAVAHDSRELARVLAGRHLLVHADLGLGGGAGHVLSNDLTHAYIDENKGTS
jgi:glutamate N-acetyltransferase/amino-acid N-acetyltransferase